LTLEAFVLSFNLIASLIAIPLSLMAIIKVLAMEKSTHKVQFVPLDPMGQTSDAELEAGLQRPQGRYKDSDYATPQWDKPMQFDPDENPQSETSRPLPPLVD